MSTTPTTTTPTTTTPNTTSYNSQQYIEREIDGQWFKGIVVSQNNTTVDIFYNDTKLTERNIPLNEVRPLPTPPTRISPSGWSDQLTQNIGNLPSSSTENTTISSPKPNPNQTRKTTTSPSWLIASQQTVAKAQNTIQNTHRGVATSQETVARATASLQDINNNNHSNNEILEAAHASLSKQQNDEDKKEENNDATVVTSIELQDLVGLKPISGIPSSGDGKVDGSTGLEDIAIEIENDDDDDDDDDEEEEGQGEKGEKGEGEQVSDDVQQLMAMGFTKKKCIHALNSKITVALAINYLLENGGSDSDEELPHLIGQSSSDDDDTPSSAFVTTTNASGQTEQVNGSINNSNIETRFVTHVNGESKSSDVNTSTSSCPTEICGYCVNCLKKKHKAKIKEKGTGSKNTQTFWRNNSLDDTSIPLHWSTISNHSSKRSFTSNDSTTVIVVRC